MSYLCVSHRRPVKSTIRSVCVCGYLHVHVCVNMHVCVHVCVHVCAHVYMYVCTYVSVLVHMCMYMMCVCVHGGILGFILEL